MRTIFLCKGPPIGWFYYAIVIFIVSLVLSGYFMNWLFNRPFYKNIENDFYKFLLGLGNIITAFLGGAFFFLIFSVLGLFLF